MRGSQDRRGAFAVLAVTLGLVVGGLAATPGSAGATTEVTSTPAVPVTSTPAVPAGTGLISHGLSSNWSGYADYGSSSETFDKVSGSWVQPSLTCPGGVQASAYWVGLDGDTLDVPTSTTVEQTGTEADCLGRNSPSDYAWYALYPGGPQQSLSPTSYPVAAGDRIDASVTETTQGDGTQDFTLTIADSGNGTDGTSWSFTTTLTVVASSAAELATAEWIAEAPSLCGPRHCRTLSLADFGTVTFSGAVATSGSTTGPIDSPSWSNDPITMIDPPATATPGAVSDNSGSSSFTVTYASPRGHGRS